MGAGMTLAKRRLMLSEPHLETAQSDGILTLDADMRAPLKALRVGFEPVQDLHGYENPWPAGGGANKWDEEWEYGAYGSIGQKIDSSTAIRNVNPIPVVAGDTYYIVRPSGAGNIRTVFRNANDENIRYVNSATQTRTAPEGAVTLDFCIMDYGKAYENDISVNNPSTVTTYSPYSNICPITGWDGVNVQRAGKNRLDPSPFNAYKIADGVFRPRASWIVNTHFKVPSDFIGKECVFSATLDLTNSGTLTWARAYAHYGNSTSSGTTIRNGENGKSIVVFTPRTEDDYVAITYGSNGSNYLTISQLQLELGSTATSYEPYAGSTVPISWSSSAGTVYGGYLEWLRDGTVKLTKTMEYVTGLENASWSRGVNNEEDGYVFFTTFGQKNAASKMLCSRYKYAGTANSNNGAWNKGDGTTSVFTGSNKRVYVRDDRFNGVIADFKASLTGMQLVYTLATPITYTLTPQEALRTLRGENNLWSDANGAISATIWKH